MKYKRMKTILLVVGVLLILYSFCAGAFGSGVYVPLSEEGAIGQSMNLNDSEAAADKNGYIYMLGNRVVQRFNQDGEFCGGGYYYANQKQSVYHNSLLSLSGRRIACYRSGRLVVFDENFNVVEKIENYDRNNLYTDYPNDDCDEDAEIKLGLFNTVEVNGEKIKLDAYRNMLFSSTAGFVAFPIGWLCVFVWLVWNEKAKGKKALFARQSLRAKWRNI
ncbi:MAG: hypothetical protein LUG52_07430 [Clostridia bacterium]|nr:hypothetical protein [Clostridia bacterium]